MFYRRFVILQPKYFLFVMKIGCAFGQRPGIDRRSSHVDPVSAGRPEEA